MWLEQQVIRSWIKFSAHVALATAALYAGEALKSFPGRPIYLDIAQQTHPIRLQR